MAGTPAGVTYRVGAVSPTGPSGREKSSDSARNFGWRHNPALEKSRVFPRDLLLISSIFNLERKHDIGIVENENQECNG
jgi:hypothetical protein